MGSESLDKRIAVDISGSKFMRGEQRGQWINPTKSVKKEDERLRSLTANQRKVYDNIMNGVSGEALESITGLDASEINKAMEELTVLGILRAKTQSEIAKEAMDELDKAQKASVYEGGQVKYEEAKKKAALALSGKGDIGTSEAKRLLGAEGMKNLYSGNNWTYSELLNARRLTGEATKMPDVGWKGVKEVKSSFDRYKDEYKQGYEKSYGDWYSGLQPEEKTYVESNRNKYRKSEAQLDIEAEDYWNREVAPKW